MLKNDSRAKFIDRIEVPQSGYAIVVQWYIQTVVDILECVVEGIVPIVESNCDLVLAGYDDDVHQVHRTRSYYVFQLRGRTWSAVIKGEFTNQ